MPDNEAPRPASLDPADIQSADVPRRSFLRGFGLIAGTAALTTQAACASAMGGSDSCTEADPYDTSDSDAYDAAGEGGDPQCDSD